MLEGQQDLHGLKAFTQQRASRGHLIVFMVISEKPDKTLSKTLFWHPLIIHSVWWRSSTPKVFFQGLLPHSYLTCPLILPRASSVNFLCPSSCSCHFPEHSLSAPRLENQPSCPDKRKPSPFEVGLRNRSCLVYEDGLFPASVPTHSLSHAHSPPLYISLLLLHCFITAFADVLTSQVAQDVGLCPVYENLISLAEGIIQKNITCMD